MKKIGVKIFFNKKCWVLIPTITFYYFKKYKQDNGNYYPNEYILAFVFLNLNIEIWNNKFWKGIFKINK